MSSKIDFHFLNVQHGKISALINNDRETVRLLIVARDQIVSELTYGDAGESNVVVTVNVLDDLINTVSHRIACRIESLIEVESAMGVE